MSSKSSRSVPGGPLCERPGVRSPTEPIEHGADKIPQPDPVSDGVSFLIQARRGEAVLAVGRRKVTDQADSAESREHRRTPVIEEHRSWGHRPMGDTDPMKFPYRFDQRNQDTDRLSGLQVVSNGQQPPQVARSESWKDEAWPPVPARREVFQFQEMAGRRARERLDFAVYAHLVCGRPEDLDRGDPITGRRLSRPGMPEVNLRAVSRAEFAHESIASDGLHDASIRGQRHPPPRAGRNGGQRRPARRVREQMATDRSYP